jgi:capsular polysaccharide transport system ATP-binding protein
VSKELGRGRLRKLVLDQINWAIQARTRFVILGQRGAGKSTLLQVISGARFPTSGWVERKGSICSVGLSLSRVRGTMTARQQAMRLARLYHVNPDAIVRFVEEFAEMHAMLDTPLKMLPKSARPRFSYALAYAIPFDFYLFDGAIGGRKGEFAKRCQSAFEARSRQASVILATSNPRQAERFDGMAGILHQGRLHLFPTVDQALSVFRALPPPEEEKREYSDDDDADDEEPEEWF